jgi:hypothetical protein
VDKQGLKVGDLCLIVSGSFLHTGANVGRAVTLELFVPAGSSPFEYKGGKYGVAPEDAWVVSGEDLWHWTIAKGYQQADTAGVLARRLRKIGDQNPDQVKSTEKEKECV